MKIQLELKDLKMKKLNKINDKIKLGYSLTNIEATLKKDAIVKQTWTENQQTYLDSMENRLNTKIDDVETRLNAKIDDVETRLNAKIDDVETRLNAKIDDVEARLNTKIDNVETRLNEKIDKVDKKVDLLRSDIFNLFKINGFKTE